MFLSRVWVFHGFRHVLKVLKGCEDNEGDLVLVSGGGDDDDGNDDDDYDERDGDDDDDADDDYEYNKKT